MRKLTMLLLIVSGFMFTAAGLVFTIMSFIEKQTGLGVGFVAITFFTTLLYFMFVSIIGSSLSRNRKMELARLTIIVGAILLVVAITVSVVSFSNGIYTLHQVVLQNNVDATPSTLFVRETTSSNANFIWAFYGLSIIAPSALTVIAGPMMLGITEY